MKIYIKTYGCQMNERDSEAVGALLADNGHELVDDEGVAEAIIVNTCSVRDKAESKALGKMGILTSAKRGVPGRIVGAMGCMVERMKDDIFTRLPGLDFAAGTRSYANIVSILNDVSAERGAILDVGGENESLKDLSSHRADGRSAFVNILLGCDRRCTYCIVPEVRGPEWSRPGSVILDEVRSLTDSGTCEVTLLGQSVMRYGKKNKVWPDDHISKHGYSEAFSILLEEVSAIEGIKRVRFTSGHPSGCTPELAKAISEIPEVCEHLHLPVQSGSDVILEKMRRGYTADKYRSAIASLRAEVPGIALTTDVIVGFPGETDADFEKTREFMEEIGFDNAFIFKYSPRPGTKAEGMEDNIPDSVKQDRNRILLEDQEKRGIRINSNLVGSIQEVLAEGVSLRNSEKWSGRSSTNKIVIFDHVDGLQAGSICSVKIDRALPQTLYGSVV